MGLAGDMQDWADKITTETDEKGWTLLFPDGKRVREYYATGEIMAMPTSEDACRLLRYGGGIILN